MMPDLSSDEYKELASRLPSVDPVTGLPRGTAPTTIAAINRAAGHPTSPTFMPRVAEAPDVSAGAGIPTIESGVPSIARPTTQQSHAAGRAEYAAGLPRVTATPFTPEYFQQEQQLADFKAAHPLGSEISARPGFLGKLEHGLAKAGNIAGEAVIPNVMRNIPGTDLNLAAKTAGREAGFEAATTAEEREAQAKNLASETAQRNAPGEKLVGAPQQDPTTGNWFQAAASKDAQGNEVVSWKPLAGGPTGGDETKKPVGDTYAQQFSQQLGTLTAGMSADDQAKFTQAYGIKPTDTGVVAEKRLADAKAAAQMTGQERDRKVQEDATAAQRAETNRLKEEELNLKKNAGENKGGTEVVRGYDANGVPHLMSAADAKTQGLTNITKATDKDIDTARTHGTVLNDMQVKLNDVVKSSPALNQNEAQRAIIAKALSDQKNTTWSQLLTSGVLSQATEPTKEYVQSVLSLRESALGLPKEITGGSRVSEIQASALWSTLPGAASLDSKYALGQAKKFQANIDRLWHRVDQVQGMPHEEPAEEIAEKKAAGGGTFNVPEGAPPAMNVPDGKVLKDESGKIVAVAHGGKWGAP